MSLYVLISGYGKFLNITENPSSDLAKLVASSFEDTFSDVKIKLLDHKTLEVRPDVVEGCMKEWKVIIEQKKREKNNNRFLIINMGVNAGISTRNIHFERYCWNSRNFHDDNSLGAP